MGNVSVVILAGGEDDTLYLRFGTSYWALVPIKKKSMIDYVIDAFQSSVGVQDILVVGPWTKGLKDYRGCRVVAGGDRHIDNVESGLREVLEKVGKGPVIISTCDIPALTAEAVTQYIEACQKSEVLGVCFPITLVSDCEREFHGMKRTSFPLREGLVTAGNMYYGDVELFLSKIEQIRPLVRDKKSVVRLAVAFGLAITVKVIMSKCTGKPYLSLEQLERKASKILGAPVRAVWADYPCIAADIDTREQLDQYIAML